MVAGPWLLEEKAELRVRGTNQKCQDRVRAKKRGSGTIK